MKNSYVPTIGIEVHVELKTNTKIFSPSKNSYDECVNVNINEIDLAYPGVLPTVNSEVVEKALKASLALNCLINKKMHFDRKNYYYPDLPKGYQITQNKTPIGYDGYVLINTNDGVKKIEIERIHMEEDTCKSIHINNKTLLNYNRAGVPLIEIVTKPCISNGDEAVKYLEELKETLFYLGVSDCKIEEGSMRADVNVSVSKDNKLGTKCEVKNIGSISSVKTAIDYEINRQIDLLEKGVKIEEETRRFDAKTSSTILMRKKEVGNDYRYFPEPDIPYLYLEDSYINEVKESIKFLPNERRNIYKSKNISDINIEKLIANKSLSDYLNKYIDFDIDFKIASNILLGDITSYLNKNNISINDTNLDKNFVNIVNMLSKGSISSKIFKDILEEVLTSNLSVEEILKEKNITLMSDTSKLEEIIKKVLKENETSVNDYKSGKQNALKFLMGMIMKETKGSANPKMVNDMLLDLLSKDVN